MNLFALMSFPMRSTREWLESIGLGQYAGAFEENAVEWAHLPNLDHDILKELGVRAIGHRMTILKAAESVSDEPAPAPQPAEPTSPPAARTRTRQDSPSTRAEAERRQLTIMFADLTDSTAMSQRLDMEDLREVNRAYQAAVTAAIERFEGSVARYMGDGVLAYFGYPRAREDDAERAVRAGLAVVEAVQRVDVRSLVGADIDLSARVGIATGPVVVGDLIGEGASEEWAVVGEAPNLAARLQAEAEPSAVLVSQVTHALTRGFFVFEDLGQRNLKGFEAPQDIRRVVAARTPVSRYEALHDEVSSELVGRRSELSLLQERWESAAQGEGQVVLIGGEPGIGKSRLTEELVASSDQDPHHTLRYQCAPNQINTPYHPFVSQLQQVIGLEAEESTDRKLDRIEAFATTAAPGAEHVAALLAALLSLPTQRYGDLWLQPGTQKTQTVAVFETLFASLIQTGPLLVVFEDAHWIDPTSQEVLDVLVAATVRLPVLIVITHRPEYRSPWRGHGHVTELRLNHLRQADCVAIIDVLCDERVLPEEVSQAILAKTDGVPLFVEELTKTVLASGILTVRGREYELVSPLAEIAIPSTLSDSLMARLDRLPEARSVAQIGACIGREFSYSMVTAASEHSPGQVDEALGQLEAERLISRRGVPPDARYTFKHALIRDAAAGSLLNKDRRRVHGKIAALLAAMSGFEEEQPELLAHHFTEAGASEDAVAHWLRAGEKAARQEAHREAAAHLSRGLELVARLSEGNERDRRELDFQIALGTAVLQSMGYGAARGERAYARARELFERLALEDPRRQFTVLSGLRRSYMHHGQLDAAMDASSECMRLAEETQDSDMLRDAHHSLGNVHWLKGECVASVTQFELGTRYDVLNATARKSVPLVGHAVNHSTGALALWASGYPERAREWSDKVLDFERKLAHPYFKTYYLCLAGVLSARLKDYDSLLDQATRAFAGATEHQLTMLEGWSGALIGWAQTMTGRSQDTTSIEQGIATTDGSGSITFKPFLETLLAEAFLELGQAPAGLEAIARAEGLAAKTRICEWESETSRVKAELLRLSRPDDWDAAEVCLRKASEVARRQQAKSLELRSTVSLSRLLAESGRQQEALDELSTVYAWFSEGFDTTDHREARDLLAQLSR